MHSLPPPAFEPYRIRTIEPIRMTTPRERRAALERAGFDLFRVPADLVLIDLLTDSGVGALSTAQWSAMMQAQESYAGSVSHERLADSTRRVTGIGNVIPTSQGRAAERLLAETLISAPQSLAGRGVGGGGRGSIVPSNAHFDTTRHMIERHVGGGAEAVSLLAETGRDPDSDHPFKGDIALDKLAALLERCGDDVPLVMLTLTCNSNGGQPVSLANVRAARALCDRFGKLLILDACRVAENAWLIQRREPAERGRTIADIVREIFDLCDGAALSGRKDILCNTGGMLLLRDDELHQQACGRTVLTQGFGLSYGGVAARDMEAMAIGLQEAIDPQRLAARAATLESFAARLGNAGVPIVQPVGGHAIFIDAGTFCPHLATEARPAHALACALYEHGGVRGCCVSSLLRRHGRPLELLRLAVPRRAYTDAHLAYAAHAVIELWHNRGTIAAIDDAADWSPRECEAVA